jgi:cytochrome bd-type quinol oxidase subunit 1
VDGVQFPLLGNSIILALVILIHVFFAFFAVGGLALAVAAEWWGGRKADADYLRLSRGISGFLSDMMKVNGVLGAAIVVLTIGLWGQFAAFLYSAQFWPFLLEGATFLLLMIFSILYHRTWDRAPRTRHILLGLAAATFALLAGFLINGIWAFMMVPGHWLQSHSRWDAFFTPILPESSLHLLLPCLTNAALLVFLWTYFKSTRTSGSDQSYYRKMNVFTGRIGAALILLQPLSGISFLFKVKAATQNLPTPNPWAHLTSGLAKPFLLAMITLAVIAALASILYWILGHQNGRTALAVAALAMFVAFFMGAFTRERARKPYLVWNTMAMNQQFVGDKKTPVSQPAVAARSAAADGAQVFRKSECQNCHKYQSKGGSLGPDLSDLKSRFDRPKLMAFVRDPPPPANMDMPAFEGSDDELGALADHLLQ